MTIAAAVKRFLDRQGIIYQVTHHDRTNTLEEAALEMGVDMAKIARSVLLKDDLGVVMAVLPTTHRLDLVKLRALLGRDVQLLSGKVVNQFFADCEPGSRPPIGEAYGIACVIDESLASARDVYFEPGCHHTMVHVGSYDFQDLLAKALRGRFAYFQEASHIAIQGQKNSNKGSYQVDPCLPPQSVNAYQRLPKIHLMLAILEACGKEPLCVSELNGLMNKEPLLACVIAQYQQAFLWQGADHSLPTTGHCSAYLGMGFLAFLAFDVPLTGPFGRRAIFEQALWTGAVAYRLAQHCQPTLPIDAEQILLCALLQDIGVILSGYLFPPEYQMLNRLGKANPGLSLSIAERRMLGMGQAHQLISMGHERIGAWLLDNWGFPAPVVTCAAHHHQSLDGIDPPVYLSLLQLANSLYDKVHRPEQCDDAAIAKRRQHLALPNAICQSVQDEMKHAQPTLQAVSASLFS